MDKPTGLKTVKEMDYLRQKDIVPIESLGEPVHIIGAGGIGSPVAMTLGKMGCEAVKILVFNS